jgi:hypothetical protein
MVGKGMHTDLPQLCEFLFTGRDECGKAGRVKEWELEEKAIKEESEVKEKNCEQSGRKEEGEQKVSGVM